MVMMMMMMTTMMKVMRRTTTIIDIRKITFVCRNQIYSLGKRASTMR